MNLKKEMAVDLKKHINLIHCTNSFSLMQRKLFNVLLHNAYKDLPTKKSFIISTKHLCSMIGYNSNDSENLKKALLDLMSITIQWNIIDNSSEKDDKWRASTALASVQIERGICTYEYSSVMQELLYQPEIYARIDMTLLPRFKSSYGLSLYENCIRYKNIPQTPWFPLDIFKKLMGVGENNYIIFRDFKRRVLDVAIKEVNTHSPISVIPEIKRISNKVVGVRFLINLKDKPHEKSLNKSMSNRLVERLINDFKLSNTLIENLFASYEENYIREKMDLIINSDSFKLKKIRDMSAYLIVALKDNYKIEKSKVVPILEKNNTEEIRKRNEEEKLSVLKNKYKVYMQNEIDQVLLSMSTESLADLNGRFLEHLKLNGNIVYRMYLRRGQDHPAVKAYFYDFIKSNYQNYLDELLNFDNFMNKYSIENNN